MRPSIRKVFRRTKATTPIMKMKPTTQMTTRPTNREAPWVDNSRGIRRITRERRRSRLPRSGPTSITAPIRHPQRRPQRQTNRMRKTVSTGRVCKPSLSNGYSCPSTSRSANLTEELPKTVQSRPGRLLQHQTAPPRSAHGCLSIRHRSSGKKALPHRYCGVVKHAVKHLPLRRHPKLRHYQSRCLFRLGKPFGGQVVRSLLQLVILAADALARFGRQLAPLDQPGSNRKSH